MTELKVGDKAPKFTLPASGGGTASLDRYADQYLILYFYPKDDTPGCTKEAIGFSEVKAELTKLNAAVLGVSKDTPTKHDKFIAKHDLTITLGSDESGEMLKKYGVWKEKSMYGKTYMGIQRATFLIGPDHKILEIWPKVRVKGHIEAVLEAVKKHAG